MESTTSRGVCVTCVHNPAGCECHRLYDEQVTGRASDFRALLRRHDGCAVETSKAQIRKAQPPPGFGGVQPGDSMEAYMVEPQHADLFVEEEDDKAALHERAGSSARESKHLVLSRLQEWRNYPAVGDAANGSWATASAGRSLS